MGRPSKRRGEATLHATAADARLCSRGVTPYGFLKRHGVCVRPLLSHSGPEALGKIDKLPDFELSPRIPNFEVRLN